MAYAAGCSTDDHAGGPASNAAAPGGSAAAPAIDLPAGSPSLDAFLALSAALTGFAITDLDATTGGHYLRYLVADDGVRGALAALIERSGVRVGAASPTVAGLERAGIYTDAASRSLANQITTYWYTGTFGGGSVQQVVTFTDALAWKAIRYTDAVSQCSGNFGAWADRPTV